MTRTRSFQLVSALVASFSLSIAGCGAMPDEAPGEAVAEKVSEQVVTCPSPKSCAGWSSWYNLGSSFCQSSLSACPIEFCRPCNCTQDGCDECCSARPGPGTQQKQEGFRDCTLQNGSRCREYRERTILLGCGC